MVMDEYKKLEQYATLAQGKVAEDEYTDTIAGYWDYIEQQVNALEDDEKRIFYDDLSNSVINVRPVSFKLFLLSVLLYYYRDTRYSDCMVETAIKEQLDVNEKYFLVSQLLAYDFANPNIICKDTVEKLYLEVADYWREYASGCVDLGSRRNNRILIISGQVAGLRHAPTKTLFERIEVFQNDLNKEVLVIHARESLNHKEYFPFYHCKKANIINEYDGVGNIQLPSGCTFRMYQPTMAMPNEREILTALELVKEYEPEEIIVMGDHCVLGEVLSDYYPTINMAFGFSILQPVRNSYSVVFRQMNEEDYNLIDKWGIDRNRYFSGTFTFKFIPQTRKYTREELGIPKDRFVIPLIGNRLGTDITGEFINMFECIQDRRWFLLFAGAPEGFDYAVMCEKYPILEDNSLYLGYVEDVLAVLECCDLYVNPPRLGGGFSVAEAFSRGLPGVSLSYGDVAAAAGHEFCVDTLDEMKSMIEKYMQNQEFYDEMSIKAQRRAQVLQDGKAALEEIMNEFKSRYKKENLYD